MSAIDRRRYYTRSRRFKFNSRSAVNIIVSELEVTNESESLIDEPSDAGRDENADGKLEIPPPTPLSRLLQKSVNGFLISVTSDGSRVDPSIAGTSHATTEEMEENREAEAVTKTSESRQSPQPVPTTYQTARRGNNSGRPGRNRPGIRTPQPWSSSPRTPQQPNQGENSL